ncbi:hypothetical protein F3W84_02865 [Ochrobactrum quorumnocens]|uniref:Uncharacterized protein n=1 Tax=Ochrobactrum quorumnocens TaxID=271865 RepID=A0A5N1K8Q0_9HYPH|nr:hypothetical protein F3W84_02865 [[Ochrobactrum] quorumnocens]
MFRFPRRVQWHCARLKRFQLRSNRRNRSNYLFLRISERKTGSHFCWKCFKAVPAKIESSEPL